MQEGRDFERGRRLKKGREMPINIGRSLSHLNNNDEISSLSSLVISPI